MVEMSFARAMTVLVVACVGLVLTGCYGSTRRATNVKFDGAQLNARGTTNNGPASTYFEYWPTSNPSAKLSTFPQPWPGGLSGPFSETLSADAFTGALYASTAYSFRMCGNDQGQPPVCAQTRHFRTPAPTQDVVEGYWRDVLVSPHSDSGYLHVTSGPSGQNPSGTIFYGRRSSYYLADYAGRVTCMQVTGRRAVIGTVGDVTFDITPPNPYADPPTATLLVTIVDGGPGVVDQVGVTLTPGSSTPPDCSAPPTPKAEATQTVNVYAP